MGSAGDHELAAPVSGDPSLLPALVDRGSGDGLRRAPPPRALYARVQQITGEWRALGSTGNPWPPRRPRSHTMGSDAPGAGAQGDAIVFPGHHSMVAADPVDGAGGSVRVQHQVPAVARRRDHL